MRLNSSLYALMNGMLDVLPGFGRSNTLRGWLASAALKKCGRKTQISSHVHIFNPQKVTLGDHVYIGCCCYFGGGEITIEDEVNIGPFVTLAAGNHTIRDGSYRFGAYEFGTIHIGRGTWLCANSVITSGVTIGEGCLVAAGSVVTKDVPSFSMVGGVPAKFIKAVAPNFAEALRAHKTTDGVS